MLADSGLLSAVLTFAASMLVSSHPRLVDRETECIDRHRQAVQIPLPFGDNESKEMP